MGWYLLVKDAKELGIKYLCKLDDRQDPYEYRGSGKLWKRYLKKHNPKLETTILGHFETMSEFRAAGEHYSDLWNVVESKEWANLIPEIGDGGSTTNGMVRAYNLSDPKEQKCFKFESDIPDGWVRGCPKWKKSEDGVERTRQSHMGKKRNETTRQKMSDAWKGKRSDSGGITKRPCIYCGRVIDRMNIGRHENKFCKERIQ